MFWFLMHYIMLNVKNSKTVKKNNNFVSQVHVGLKKTVFFKRLRPFLGKNKYR